MILASGADKVSVNSAAIAHPQLIKEAADEFGVQCVVIAIDAKKEMIKVAGMFMLKVEEKIQV